MSKYSSYDNLESDYSSDSDYSDYSSESEYLSDDENISFVNTLNIDKCIENEIKQWYDNDPDNFIIERVINYIIVINIKGSKIDLTIPENYPKMKTGFKVNNLCDIDQKIIDKVNNKISIKEMVISEALDKIYKIKDIFCENNITKKIFTSDHYKNYANNLIDYVNNKIKKIYSNISKVEDNSSTVISNNSVYLCDIPKKYRVAYEEINKWGEDVADSTVYVESCTENIMNISFCSNRKIIHKVKIEFPHNYPNNMKNYKVYQPKVLAGYKPLLFVTTLNEFIESSTYDIKIYDLLSMVHESYYKNLCFDILFKKHKIITDKVINSLRNGVDKNISEPKKKINRFDKIHKEIDEWKDKNNTDNCYIDYCNSNKAYMIWKGIKTRKIEITIPKNYPSTNHNFNCREIIHDNGVKPLNYIISLNKLIKDKKCSINNMFNLLKNKHKLWYDLNKKSIPIKIPAIKSDTINTREIKQNKQPIVIKSDKLLGTNKNSVNKSEKQLEINKKPIKSGKQLLDKKSVTIKSEKQLESIKQPSKSSKQIEDNKMETIKHEFKINLTILTNHHLFYFFNLFYFVSLLE